MQSKSEITFGQFRLDLANECLWSDGKPISLRPKAFAVLKLLAEHPHQLVNKQRLLDAVWPETFVGDAVLKDNIRQIREALGDDADAPIYIETAHRRGYRFIGTASPQVQREHGLLQRNAESQMEGSVLPATPVLGREAELAKLRSSLERTLTGKRQSVLIAGEPGIGKTTLVETFLEQTANIADSAIARGQCLEQYGSGEAYLPVLDGISRLCRSPKAERVISCLRQHAPTWVSQMPSLMSQAEAVTSQTQVVGATRERMLREIADAIEALTQEFPLLLVLEDLHWSDYSTLDLVSYLARRQDPARLMIIGTYRPVDVILNDHPLKSVRRELQAHNLCREIALEFLSEDAVGEYLNARFPEHRLPDELRNAIYMRTEGNPLFMVNMVDFLCDEEMIAEEDGHRKLRVAISDVEKSVPDSIRQLIERQIERLTADQHEVLDAASVAGMEFSTSAVAAGIDKPLEWVEQRCEELVRRHQFFSPGWTMELPDGTITPRHRFTHVLYRDVPYHLLTPLRRQQIHHRIAMSGAAIYGARNAEIAAELAMHFEQSRDWHHAVEHIIQAARNASAKSAHHEAAELARHGLALQKSLAKSPDRDTQEIALATILSASLMALKGFASSEVEQVYTERKELFEQSPPSPQLFNVLYLLGISMLVGGKIRSALGVAERLMALTEELENPTLEMEAHRSMGSTLQKMGRCREALDHLGRACQLYSENHNHPYILNIGHDCKALSICSAANAMWALGFPDSALKQAEEGLGHARNLAHAQSLVAADHYAALLYGFRGEHRLARQRAEEMIDVARQQGFELWSAFGDIQLGSAQARLGEVEDGIQNMKKGLAAYSGTGGKLWCPYFLGVLAEALGSSGRVAEALEVIGEAVRMAEENEELFSVAELWRVKGELLLKYEDSHAECRVKAGECFGKSLEVARSQQLKSWELRTMMSLHRHGFADVDTDADLSVCYGWFSEGFATADLAECRAMLEAQPNC